MDPGRRLRVATVVIILLIVAIAVLLILATVPLVDVERPGVTWHGFTLGPSSHPYDTVVDTHVGQFCPPQGDNSALVVGNVTVSLTWATVNGKPISNFNVFASGYPVLNDTFLGTYVYFVNNSSSGSFSSESPTISVSLCNYPLTIGASVATGDSVAVTIETVYTYTTTATVL